MWYSPAQRLGISPNSYGPNEQHQSHRLLRRKLGPPTLRSNLAERAVDYLRFALREQFVDPDLVGLEFLCTWDR